jgi:L-lactate dehydrogenase (cytochrome)
MTQTINPGNPEAPTTPEATAPRHCALAAAAPTAGAVPAALKRRVPKYSDLTPLMQFKNPEFNRAARLRRTSTI